METKDSMNNTPFKNECNTEINEKHAASILGKKSRDHGVELENWLHTDINGVINGYNGYSIYSPNAPTTIPFEQEQWLTYNDELMQPDIVVFGNPNNRPVFILESKGTINECWYNCLWHAEKFTEKGIPYIVITKDTKRAFKSGETRYLNFAKNLDIKVFINNHNNYDDGKKAINWEDYNWNDIVKPYMEFPIYISNLIKAHFNIHGSNKFFNFENKI
jgi:hypothetical protein